MKNKESALKSPIRILHLEDNPGDARLVQATLEAEDIPCATLCVHSHEDFVAALEHGGIDLILSDFTLPGFDGMTALKIAHATWPSIPLIFVSGTMGEQRAIDSLKNGATDYVLKGTLARLAPAVRRAMHEVEEQAHRRRLEAQFIEAQKMEVIGHLAGGIAHDFNNILAVILGYSELIMQDLGPDEVNQSRLETIRSAAERAAGLTRQLLIFSRKQTVHPVVLDLNEVLQDLDKMLRRLIDDNIELTIVPAREIGHVQADSGYVGQVVMNLVVNARDAMPNGGELRITTSNITLHENCARTHKGVIPGDYVMLSVCDTGSGMAEEVKARIFEPFFTTKPKGQGTGLGLATCQSIIQQSGAYIGVRSEAGQGATFNLFFPRVEQPLDVAIKSDKARPWPRGTECLLVVEDEPSVRLLAGRILKDQGYEVLSACNGQDALNVVSEYRGSAIRLVFTDLIMPLMSGKVMAEWLKITHPDLKVLFTSGYTEDAITQYGVFEMGVAFMPKPYTPALLAFKVREMLDAT
jgi:signal transduction histidine kinase